jgi:hypothetical protein
LDRVQEHGALLRVSDQSKDGTLVGGPSRQLTYETIRELPRLVWAPIGPARADSRGQPNGIIFRLTAA